MSTTMEDKFVLKAELLKSILAYHSYINGDSPSEDESIAMIEELDRLVPHANISDLIFWGEKERTDEEVVEEALFRESVRESSGRLGLLLHIQSQLDEVASNVAAKPVHRN